MFKGIHIYIRPFVEEDAAALLGIQKKNRNFFERFSMERSKDFYSIESQRERIRRFEEDQLSDQAYNFGIFKDDGTLIGTINLFQVVRGSLQSAFIGFFLDKKTKWKRLYY